MQDSWGQESAFIHNPVTSWKNEISKSSLIAVVFIKQHGAGRRWTESESQPCYLLAVDYGKSYNLAHFSNQGKNTSFIGLLRTLGEIMYVEYSTASLAQIYYIPQ